MIQYEQQTKSYLQRIANILMLNGGFLVNPGLYTGEMGLVLFFFRYGRYTSNKLFLDYALNLLEKIQRRIYIETPINYKEGLNYLRLKAKEFVLRRYASQNVG